jgi:hypothetical protein
LISSRGIWSTAQRCDRVRDFYVANATDPALSNIEVGWFRGDPETLAAIYLARPAAWDAAWQFLTMRGVESQSASSLSSAAFDRTWST